jgi:hypothetical protein
LSGASELASDHLQQIERWSQVQERLKPLFAIDLGVATL